jgi:hypothetical protein
MSYASTALDTRLGARFMESVTQLPDALETLTKAVNNLVESKSAPRAITEKKKYYMVTKAARDGSEPIHVSAIPYTTLEHAAEGLVSDILDEVQSHDWDSSLAQILHSQVTDGFTVRSPDSDQDHEYVWKVFEVYI